MQGGDWGGENTGRGVLGQRWRGMDLGGGRIGYDGAHCILSPFPSLIHQQGSTLTCAHNIVGAGVTHICRQSKVVHFQNMLPSLAAVAVKQLRTKEHCKKMVLCSNETDVTLIEHCCHDFDMQPSGWCSMSKTMGWSFHGCYRSLALVASMLVHHWCSIAKSDCGYDGRCTGIHVSR